MKTPFTITDFSGGMKGKKGQLNSADTKYVQDLNNMLVERNNTLKSRNGVEELPITLLENDKVLPFESNGKKYYFVYDPLLINKYKASPQGADWSYSAGGQRHVDMFTIGNSSLSPWEYLKKEVLNHRDQLPSWSDTLGLPYTSYLGTAPQDDTTKWDVFKTYPAGTTELELHLHLRKLTLESSPTFVNTELNHAVHNAEILYDNDFGSPVIENTFWWNRMYILDEEFKIITTEVDIANYVSYDSGHTLLTPILPMDTDVRNATHDDLKTIRESRYSGSDLEYEVEVMNQGVMFFNREGKLPNMFIQLNDQGKTDGVLRDFRTLYLDEVINGTFKTAPYFTTTQYGLQQLFDDKRMQIEMEYITARWSAPDILLSDADHLLVASDIDAYYEANPSNDLANYARVKFSYNVNDPENIDDVVKAFLPLTSDSSPCVNMDNINLETPDGQVRFASPSLASLDRDYVFPDAISENIWQNPELAVELPFIFGPNLVIYDIGNFVEPITLVKENLTSPILTLTRSGGSQSQYALVPITRFAGGAIGHYTNTTPSFQPEHLNTLTSNSTALANTVAAHTVVKVYTQVFGVWKFSGGGTVEYIADPSLFIPRLGYTFVGVSSDVFYVLNKHHTGVVTTYQGSANSSSSGFTTSSSNTSEYSFKIATGPASEFSVIHTSEKRLSQAFGFNANNYFSSVSEFAGRLYLASVSKPNQIVYSSTTDYLEFSQVRALVNAVTDPVAIRGASEKLGTEGVAAFHEFNASLRVITDKRIFSMFVDKATGEVTLSDPSDIVTSGKAPVSINNFSYFVSGDNKDVLLAVFSDRTQRFEYYSVFSEINIDDPSDIVSLTAVASAYKLVVLTGNALYIGTIIQANQVAWSRLTFNFIVESISTTKDALYVSSTTKLNKLQFTNDLDLEDDVYASMKMLAPTALANLVNVQKTNINTKGMRLHDVVVVGTFDSPLQSGSDARELSAADQGDIIDVHNKNYNDIYDSIEISFEGGQNRIIYIRGSLGA